jgi:6-phosphogluconolactonase
VTPHRGSSHDDAARPTRESAGSAGAIVSRCADLEAAAARATDVLATAIDAARTVQGAAHVALSGGSNVPPVLAALGARLPEWTEVHLWYGDERVVPLDSPDSTHRLCSASLDAPGATWHPVPVELGPEGAAEAYARELDGTVLDVALQGLGPDGHTASLFPGHPQLHAAGICVAVRDSPKPPPERVTLTLGKLNESRRILMLVTGAEKAPVLARVLEGPQDAVPASLLHRSRLEIVADKAALRG